MAYGGISSIGRESREITLRNARNKIRALGQQLALRQDRIDMAFNFFRMCVPFVVSRSRARASVLDVTASTTVAGSIRRSTGGPAGTARPARKGQQLALRQDRIDMAFNLIEQKWNQWKLHKSMKISIPLIS